VVSVSRESRVNAVQFGAKNVKPEGTKSMQNCVISAACLGSTHTPSDRKNSCEPPENGYVDWAYGGQKVAMFTMKYSAKKSGPQSDANRKEGRVDEVFGFSSPTVLFAFSETGRNGFLPSAIGKGRKS
jgi:hypothetical protein